MSHSKKKQAHYSKDCWSEKNTKGDLKGKHKSKNADVLNLISKHSIVDSEVEIDEISMIKLNVDEKKRGSEWINIGLVTSAGKKAWLQSIT